MTNQPINEETAEAAVDKTTQALRTAQDKTQEALRAAQDKAQEALRTGTQYVRENPVPMVVGAFLLGGVVGAMLAGCGRREPEPAQGAREWLESTLHDIANKIPKAKKQACCIQDSLVDHAQELGRKFRFW